MKKEKTQKKWIVSSKNLLVISQAQSSSEETIAEFQAKGMNFIQKQQEVERATPSKSAQHTENATIQRRISAKMRRGTLETYKQAFLVPTKLSDRKAVYLSRATQERADFVVRRLGDRRSNLSSFVENIVRLHLEEYGEGIEKWRRL